MMATGLILAPRNPNTGLLDPDYYPVNPDNSWRIASEFEIFDDLDIEIIHPRNDAGSMARWRHAAHDDIYEIFFEFTGGKPVYRLDLSGPDNVYLGATGTARFQTYNFVADPDISGMYDLQMPDDFGLIRWEPTPDQYGNSYQITLILQDMAGRVIVHNISVSVDTAGAPKFRYVDPVNGNNANAGSKALPLQTFSYAYGLSDADDFIHVLENGTHVINNGTPGNNANITDKMKSFVGRSKDATILDMSGGHFTGAPTDVFFDNVNFNGGRVTDNNPRICSWGSRFDRLFYQRCKATNTPLGTQITGDNPCVIFTPDSTGWGNQSRWFGMRDFHIDGSVKSSLAILFKVEHVIIRKCTGYNLNMDSHLVLIPPNPSATFLRLKGKITNAEVSDCHASGFTDNSFVQWQNQNPENCDKQRTRFCTFDYTGNTQNAAITYNTQAQVGNSRSTNSRIERCSIKAGNRPIIATPGGDGGEALKVSGLLYATSGSLFTDVSNAISVNTTNVQVSASDFDSNMKMISAIKAANLGYRGGQTASTLVT